MDREPNEAGENEAQETETDFDTLKGHLTGEDSADIREKLIKAGALAGAPTRETLETLITGAANKGVMPKEALKIGDDAMEAIYSQGYTLYNQGKYKDASYVFRLLMLLDYLTPKYILGLAACYHRLKEYKNAANIYLLCGTLDTTNPLPHYHAADCYLQLETPELAIFSLGLAITAAGDQPQFAVIKERATLMKNTLEKQIQERIEAASSAKEKTT